METLKMELLAYANDSKNSGYFRTGWGCGYVIIPKNHPFMVEYKIDQLQGYSMYAIKGFEQEITFCELEKNGDLKIGFDTAHSWNDNTHDKEWVTNETKKLLKCINSYTFLDAKNSLDAYKETLLMSTNEIDTFIGQNK